MKLVLFLCAGTILMFFPIFGMGKPQKTPFWKSLVHAVVLTLVGTLGTLLMYFVENGKIGGISFFGAVFFVPLVFPLVAKALRTPYTVMLDRCAVGICVMCALMKVHCMLSGCCVGRTFDVGGKLVSFPSRTVELLVALALFCILFSWFKKGKQTHRFYPWFLILYGVTRFGLNLLRLETQNTEMLLPFGNIWSLVAVAIGVVWLLLYNNKQMAQDLRQNP